MSQIPQRPTGLEMSHAGELIFTISMVVPTVLLFLIALRLWRRNNDAVPLLCLVGGAVATFIEPIITVLGALHYPRLQEWTLFESLDQRIPVFVAFAYIWVIGGVILLAYLLLTRGASRREIWQLYAAGIVLNALIEITLQHFDNIVVYYGSQPATLLGFPTYWGFTTFAIGPIGGAVLWRLRPWLRSWRVLAVVPLIPMLCGGVYGATTWPVFNAINTGLPDWAIDLSGIASWALGALSVWAATRMLPADRSSPTTDATLGAGSKDSEPAPVG